MRDAGSAFSNASDAVTAADELAARLAVASPRCISFFCSSRHDGSALSARLRTHFPEAQVIGCTTAGAFTQGEQSATGVSALALGAAKVRRASASLARFDDGVQPGITRATSALADAHGVDLRCADPKRYIGVVLIEGLRMKEEACNDALGNVAPVLSFVGGSAGDGGAFLDTRVFVNGDASNDGAALMLLDMAAPFVVTKTCSFEPTGTRFRITRADPKNRVIHELDGRPALEAYCGALDTSPERVTEMTLMAHPFGVMIDGAPWIRSPQRVLDGGAMKFFCSVIEGTTVDLMRRTDLIGGTRAAFVEAAAALGAPVAAGLAFNCIQRRLLMDKEGLHEQFLALFHGQEAAGFHTYGESWIGHINQTLTGLFIG